MANDQKSFNTDMERYLNRRGSGRKGTSLKKRQHPMEDEREYYDSKKKKGFFGKVFGKQVHLYGDKQQAVEDEQEDFDKESQVVDMMDEENEVKKEGLMKKLFKGMRSDRKKDMDEEEMTEEVAPQLDEDVKEVLKITFHWIEKLPKAQLAQFKESEDFVKYKNILSKYGLLRQK